jgi:hypothetical protein
MLVVVDVVVESFKMSNGPTDAARSSSTGVLIPMAVLTGYQPLTRSCQSIPVTDPGHSTLPQGFLVHSRSNDVFPCMIRSLQRQGLDIPLTPGSRT